MRSKIGFITLSSLATCVALWSSAACADPQVAHGNNFIVTASVASCAANAECTIALKLQAVGDFHVNKEYPYKFKASDVAGVEFHGKDTANKNIFSKAAGDFALDAANEKLGVMAVRFKPAAKGNISISGNFKLSVCSAVNCQLEQTDLTVPVTVN